MGGRTCYHCKQWIEEGEAHDCWTTTEAALTADLHDDLRASLEETYGVVVFHEQVLRIVAVMTGCSLAEADEVRRSLGSPDSQPEGRAWFYPAARARGYDLVTIERVWEVLRAFASFGFCKAHAAAFALLQNTDLDARTIVEKALGIAADICIYTNRNVTIETL